MRFAVCTISPLDYPHSQAFAEVAEALHLGLQALGHDSVQSTRLDNRRRRHLVFGANLLPRYPVDVPDDAVLINLEQVSDDNAWMTPAYLDQLRRHRVWDYCASNLDALARRGVHAAQMPIGYLPQLSRIVADPSPDIDVLFYGSVGERRRRVLLALEEAGVNLHVAFNVYGPERDALIARSRLVLNLHHYGAQLFELVRVSYLLANRVCVVSERGQDRDLDAQFESAVRFADYDALVATCIALLGDPAACQRQAHHGFEHFRRCDPLPELARRIAELDG